MKHLPFQPNTENKDTQFVYFFGNLDRRDPAQEHLPGMGENTDMANHIRFNLPRSWAGKVLDVISGKKRAKDPRAKESLAASQRQYQSQFGQIKNSADNVNSRPELAQKGAQQEISALVGARAYRDQNEQKDWSGKMARPNSPLTNPSTLKMWHPGLWSAALGLDRLPPANTAIAAPGVTTILPVMLAFFTNGSNRGLNHHLDTSRDHLMEALKNAKNPYSKIGKTLVEHNFEDTANAFKSIIGTVPGVTGPDKHLETASLAVLDLQESVVNHILSLNIDDLFEMRKSGEEQYESLHWSARGFRQFTHGWTVDMAQASLRNMIAKSKDRIAETRRILTARNRNLNASIQGALGEAQIKGDEKTQNEIQSQIRFALENPDEFVKSGGKVGGKNSLENLTGVQNRTVILDVLNSFYAQSIIGLGYADVENANSEDYWNHIENRYEQLEVNGDDNWPSFTEIQGELQHPDNNIEQSDDPQTIDGVVAEVTRAISDAFGINIFELYKADPNTTTIFPLLSVEEQFIYLMKFLNGKLTHGKVAAVGSSLIRRLDPDAQSALLKFLNDTSDELNKKYISGSSVSEKGSIELRADMGSRAQRVIETGQVVTAPDFPEALLVAAKHPDGSHLQREMAKIKEFITSYDAFDSYLNEHRDNLLDEDVTAFEGIIARAKDFYSYIKAYRDNLNEERKTYKEAIDKLGARSVPHPDFPDDRSKDIVGNDDMSGEEIALEIKIRGYRKTLQEMQATTAISSTADTVQVDVTQAQQLGSIIDKHNTELNNIRSAKVEARGQNFEPLALQDYGNGFRMMARSHDAYMIQSGIKDRVQSMLDEPTTGEIQPHNFDDRFKRQLKKDIHGKMNAEADEKIKMASACTYEAFTRIERPEGMAIKELTLVITDLTQGQIRIPTAFSSQESWQDIKIRHSAGGVVMMEGTQDGEDFVLVMSPGDNNISNVKVYRRDNLDEDIFQHPNPSVLLPDQYEKSGAAINIQSQQPQQTAKMRSKFKKAA